MASTLLRHTFRPLRAKRVIILTPPPELIILTGRTGIEPAKRQNRRTAFYRLIARHQSGYGNTKIASNKFRAHLAPRPIIACKKIAEAPTSRIKDAKSKLGESARLIVWDSKLSS